ncbi:hypothetical protein M9978_02445 [Sphingomonas sp. MG17]|uniref:Uncharacterized protein n=1 Tax=Sphingomonas tagetis TaxID=2949092 RepID=A0A9X2HI26_9SPHN|nr:hypothetical protein [Sphingomonas tagetis]MCP3729276.1 hypothetical protein [Sphingomonas tagetis]
MPSPRVSLASVADALDRVVPELDELIREARLGTRHPLGIHELEERAQRIAAAIVAPFRAPAVPSVKVTMGKSGGAWV